MYKPIDSATRELLAIMLQLGGTSTALLSSALEGHHQWLKWSREIPYIRWPADWYVKAIPPFAGAIIRYYVSDKIEPPCKPARDHQVSIYLDCYDELGSFGAPYWEVYPIDGDTARFPLADTGPMLEVIAAEFERRKNEAVSKKEALK